MTDGLDEEALFGLCFVLGRATHAASVDDDECDGNAFCEDHVNWPDLNRLVRIDLSSWTEGHYA